jgi:DNA-binding XRE family transcriptional regulator
VAKKSIVVTHKKRGRPATGQDPILTLRLPATLRLAVESWTDQQNDKPSRSEAIRRLIEFALSAPNKAIPKVSIRQVKAGRALLAWSQEELAAAADISIPTIKRLEAHDGALGGRHETGNKIRLALEAAGVEFIDENGGGPGVRLRKNQPKKG